MVMTEDVKYLLSISTHQALIARFKRMVPFERWKSIKFIMNLKEQQSKYLMLIEKGSNG
jgi:hypothetical protein